MDEDEAKSLASDWVRRLEASVLSKVREDSDKFTNRGGHHQRKQDNVTFEFNDDLYEKNRIGAKPSPRQKIYHDPTRVSSTSDLINHKKEITNFEHQSNQELDVRQTSRNTSSIEPRPPKHSPRVDLEILRRKRLERFDKPKDFVFKDWDKNDDNSCEKAKESVFDSSGMLQYEASPCNRVDEPSLRDDKWSYDPVSYDFSKRSYDEDDKIRLELWGIRGAVESGQIDIHSYLRPSRYEDHSKNNCTQPLHDLGNSISKQSLTNEANYHSCRDNNYNLRTQSTDHQKDFVRSPNGLISEESLTLLTSKLSIQKSHMGGAVGPTTGQDCINEDFTHFSVSKHQPSTFACTVPQIEGKLYNGFETSDSESSVNAIKINRKYKPKIDHSVPDVTLPKANKPLKSGKGKQKILNELTEFLDSGRSGRSSSREKERIRENFEGGNSMSPDFATDGIDINNCPEDVLFKSSSPIEMHKNGTRTYSPSPVNGISTSAPAAYDCTLDFSLEDNDFLHSLGSSSGFQNDESITNSLEVGQDSSGTKLAKICTVCNEVNSQAANWCIECGTALINVKPAILNQEQQRNYDKQCQETKELIEEALNSKKRELNGLGALSKKERALQSDVMELSKEVEKNSGFSNESLQSNLSNYKRRWLKSSLAWSTFEPQELSKPPSLVKQSSKGKKNEKKIKEKLNGSLRSRSSSDLALIEHSKKKNKGKDRHHKTAQRQRTTSATYHSADDYDPSNLSINIELTNQESSQGSNLTHYDRPWSGKSGKVQKDKSGKRRPGSARSNSKSPSPLLLEGDTSLSNVSKKIASNATPVPALHLDDVGSYDRILTLIRSQRDDEPVPYLYLPDELLLEIFSNLSNKDLVACACVCWQFYRIAMDETLWKTIIIRKNRNICDEWLESIGDRHPSSLTITQCSSNNVTANGLRSLFRKCSESLEEVDFSGCSGSELIGESVLLHISARCLNVVSVDVSWTNVSDNGVQALAESLKRLECLCLNGCQAITDKSLTYVSKRHGESLRIFEVFGCFNITPAGLLLFGSQCLHLQTLNIGQCHKMTDSAVGNLVSHLPEIENLDLRGCKQTRDSAVKKIVRHCPHLKSLVLANCPLITDATLVEISTNLAGIRSLDICGCSYVTDAGVRALARCCHKLELLDLSSTGTAVTSKSIVALSNYCSQSLHILKLSFCPDISVNTVNQVVKNCKKLTLLHLYGCKRIKELDKVKNLNPNLVIER